MRRLKNALKYSPATRPVFLRYRRMQVETWSPIQNVYHCCTQKTASQWFRAVFRDPVFYRNTGWDVIPYRELGLSDAVIEHPLPAHSLAAHLYIDYPTFDKLAKPASHRAFFILRDPRDAVVSWYFSMRYSHSPRFGIVRELRSELQEIDDDEAGLLHMITRIAGFGFFDAQRSWVCAPESDRVRVLRYEDFAADNRSFLSDLLGFLDVDLSDAEFEELMQRHQFAARAGGRNAGESDTSSHYRKGVAGDWENHFTDVVSAHLVDVAGPIVADLGYD